MAEWEEEAALPLLYCCIAYPEAPIASISARTKPTILPVVQKGFGTTTPCATFQTSILGLKSARKSVPSSLSSSRLCEGQLFVHSRLFHRADVSLTSIHHVVSGSISSATGQRTRHARQFSPEGGNFVGYSCFVLQVHADSFFSVVLYFFLLFLSSLSIMTGYHVFRFKARSPFHDMIPTWVSGLPFPTRLTFSPRPLFACIESALRTALHFQILITSS